MKMAQEEALKAKIKRTVAEALTKVHIPTETHYDDSTGEFYEKIVNEFSEFY